MGPERGGEVEVELRLLKQGAFDLNVPLRMLPYKTPLDPRKCFDLAACYATDQANESIENHNRYITSLLSLFVNDNGCTTSANHITLPMPPDNMVETREMKLKDIFKDKYGSLVLAIHYLEERGKYCSKDYSVENAVQTSNDIAYVEAVKHYKRDREGNVRFRIPGSPPATWSGTEGERDSFGRLVKWEAGKNHSFLSPEARVVLDNRDILPQN
jgi:hypothetical protein